MVISLLAAWLAPVVPCAAASSKPGAAKHFDGYAFVSTYYDDNVFDYSDRDRDRYEAGDTTGKYPIDDLADNVTTLAARADYRWNIEARSLWRMRLLYDGTFYARNTDRSSHRVGASLERQLRHSDFSLDVGYMPDYYLRYLYWRPSPERPPGVRYAEASYDKLSIAADARTRLSRSVDGVFGAGFARRDYAYPFDERDNNTVSLDAGVEADLHRRFDAALRLTADLSKARGADEGATAVDISNNRFGFVVSGTWRAHRWLRLSQSFDYGHQVYTTDHVADVSHYDRVDDELYCTTELQMVVVDGWQPQALFQYRTSDTTVPPGIAESGQFTGVRFGLQVTRYF